jgi:2-polyprenyl-3-methyl-5-hydroxy-6-metoxy-1,4-benzoquinol methylase
LAFSVFIQSAERGTSMTHHELEIRDGQRFRFGDNWARFLEVLDEDRIHEAENSLVKMLGLARLDGLTFLDVGSGSGLFSLAAHRLGAKVHSFDYDPQSVATTAELRRRYAGDSPNWTIESGSVLDQEYLASLGTYDIVYSWGVLHHTGDMWQAMESLTPLVNPNGYLFIALYNDQGLVSAFWRRIKKLYCTGLAGRALVLAAFFPIFALAGLLSDLVGRRSPLLRYRDYRKRRGMSLTHDWTDWLGGYPYETAKPGEVFSFYYERGFRLTKLVTRSSLGCNEFVFHLDTQGPDRPHDKSELLESI